MPVRRHSPNGVAQLAIGPSHLGPDPFGTHVAGMRVLDSPQKCGIAGTSQAMTSGRFSLNPSRSKWRENNGPQARIELRLGPRQRRWDRGMGPACLGASMQLAIYLSSRLCC